MKTVNRIELYALKKMFQLPTTTPTPAIVYATGTLYTEVRVIKKQLLYLHKLLQKGPDSWAKKTLEIHKEKRIGWARMIMDVLESWQMETDWRQKQ